MQHAVGVPLPPSQGPVGGPPGWGQPQAPPPVAPGPGWPGGRGPEPAVTGHFPLLPGAPVAPPGPVPSAAVSLPPVTGAPVAVLLIGPAGAGKTTVARHWADRRA